MYMFHGDYKNYNIFLVGGMTNNTHEMRVSSISTGDMYSSSC